MKRKKFRTIESSPENLSGELAIGLEIRKKRVDIFLIFLMLAFGIYQAVIYWGHQAVPHFDFGCFMLLGKQILSLQVPTTFKRMPLVGILQVLLGYLTGGICPELRGGWLLNSIVHSLTPVFLFLAGRKVIGRSAVWFAVIAIINPWGLQLLTEAIAETTLLFFIWITFYFVFIRSKWAYLFAALTTMVRYEGAALVFGAFVMDMIEGRDKKERIMAFVYASIASIPLAIWLLGTFLTWGGEGSTTHYFNVFSKDFISQFAGGGKGRVGFLKHANILWQVSFSSLFRPYPHASKTVIAMIMNSSRVIAVITFLFGSIYGLYKRQWKILVLLIFLLPYFLVHSRYPYPLPRYHVDIFGIFLLICIYGLCSFWKLIKNTGMIPKWAIIIAQLVILIILLIWILVLSGYLPRIASMSRASVSLPIVSIAVVCAALAAEHFACKGSLLTTFVILVLMAAMVTSNQFEVAREVGNGERDIEFKYLLDWYIKNAKKGEKLVCTVSSILALMAPEYEDCFIHTNTFDANTPEDFVYECYRKNITYVVWDSREGFTPKDHYYKYWKMSNIAPLIVAKDIGPYQFITQIRADGEYRRFTGQSGMAGGRYVNLYRLEPLSADGAK